MTPLLFEVVVIMEELNSLVAKLLKSAQESASIEEVVVVVVIVSGFSGLPLMLSHGFEVSIGIGATDAVAFVASEDQAVKQINYY